MAQLRGLTKLIREPPAYDGKLYTFGEASKVIKETADRFLLKGWHSISASDYPHARSAGVPLEQGPSETVGTITPTAESRHLYTLRHCWWAPIWFHLVISEIGGKKWNGKSISKTKKVKLARALKRLVFNQQAQIACVSEPLLMRAGLFPISIKLCKNFLEVVRGDNGT